jgi:hypothetical protein
MVFRDSGPDEDCLYLNVWSPVMAKKQAPLPVMVWIYGGGYAAGASSEPRQDGEVLAKKGVVVVNMNYRLNVFGFLAHPALAKETPHNSSGNYGLLDQVAALEWVQKNIKAFGGNPENVTIFGESAGSFSVSGLMASPLATDLFSRAIGESGAFFGSALGLKPQSEAQLAGTRFAASVGASSLEELRAKPAADLMQAALKGDPEGFSACIDGLFFLQDFTAIYAAGKQAHVPLLAGWNADEGSYQWSKPSNRRARFQAMALSAIQRGNGSKCSGPPALRPSTATNSTMPHLLLLRTVPITLPKSSLSLRRSLRRSCLGVPKIGSSLTSCLLTGRISPKPVIPTARACRIGLPMPAGPLIKSCTCRATRTLHRRRTARATNCSTP